MRPAARARRAYHRPIVPALRVAQIVADTEAEGPGHRYAVWVQGCSIRCAGCCNPQMFDAAGGEEMAPASLAAAAHAAGVEGVTLLGGEPFEQPEACAELAEAARALGLGVMVFSGYELAALEARAAREPEVAALLAATDLLVDGPFDRARPERARRWIGSSNQRMHFLSARYAEGAPCFTAPNTVEIRLRRTELSINGWPSASARLERRR
ncbi:MAG: 4Fe-4S cluster-binding domain-containing protein [Myxococcales bacterium]|nr:4Fe-4S cluster-binding domain-containing protein [Myxococcales bacterium]